MAVNIFRVDWILVDTIIIILLVLLLISVKIFKEAYRWRFSLSNEFLTRTTAKSLSFNLDRPSIYIKKWNLTKSKVIQEEISSKPSIFIIRTNRKQMLLKILTEGLSTYGFNVVNIWLKIKADKGKSKTIRDIERKIE